MHEDHGESAAISAGAAGSESGDGSVVGQGKAVVGPKRFEPLRRLGGSVAVGLQGPTDGARVK